MSIEFNYDKNMDPFYKPEACSKCGGRLGLRVVSIPSGGTKTSQICRSCGHEILTSTVHIVRAS